MEAKSSTPGPSSPAARATMRANRRRDTKPELALRSELHRRGLRFRVDYSPPGVARCRIDVVFTRPRVAVFVDGCFWHRCPQHATTPSANREWWEAKLAANVTRDRRNDSALLAAGWAVLRIWEHEAARDAADRVVQCLRTRAETRDALSIAGYDENREIP